MPTGNSVQQKRDAAEEGSENTIPGTRFFSLRSTQLMIDLHRNSISIAADGAVAVVVVAVVAVAVAVAVAAAAVAVVVVVAAAVAVVSSY